MSVKDKVIFGLMILLLAGGGYIQYTYTKVMDRMDVLEKKQLKHVDQVNQDFSEQLRKLNLQFIGRGKHLQKAQKDIVANTELIHSTADSLTTQIEDVAYNLDEFKRRTERDFKTVKQDIQDQQEAFASQQRRDRTRFANIEEDITLIKTDIKKINDQLTGEKKKK
ncbi:MAG: hypothetical protein D6762_01180 [Candidatus Neomarinimicrobiota bacterium]|nr:MAG: hypothetical protein D6762_01180 [Candidatus Neomarinimicrobiota bacterium]